MAIPFDHDYEIGIQVKLLTQLRTVTSERDALLKERYVLRNERADLANSLTYVQEDRNELWEAKMQMHTEIRDLTEERNELRETNESLLKERAKMKVNNLALSLQLRGYQETLQGVNAELSLLRNEVKVLSEKLEKFHE